MIPFHWTRPSADAGRVIRANWSFMFGFYYVSEINISIYVYRMGESFLPPRLTLLILAEPIH